MKALIREYVRCFHKWMEGGRYRQCTKCGLNDFDD